MITLQITAKYKGDFLSVYTCGRKKCPSTMWQCTQLNTRMTECCSHARAVIRRPCFDSRFRPTNILWFVISKPALRFNTVKPANKGPILFAPLTDFKNNFTCKQRSPVSRDQVLVFPMVVFIDRFDCNKCANYRKLCRVNGWLVQMKKTHNIGLGPVSVYWVYINHVKTSRFVELDEVSEW